MIVTLGRHSLQTFMPGARISAVHGTTQPADPETGAPDATTYAMYHPAAALRQGSLKETMLVDMCGLPEVLTEARERRTSTEKLTETAAVAAPLIAAPAIDPLPAEAMISEPSLEEVGVALETAAVVAAPSATAEPQLELFG